MKAHVIQDGMVINTIVVDSLDFLPNLISAENGGIGWSYVDGNLIAPDPVPQPVTLGVLTTDIWSIPADGTTFATVTYTSDTTVYFAVESTITVVDPVDQVATIEITADAPGPIRVDVQDKRLVIVALEVG